MYNKILMIEYNRIICYADIDYNNNVIGISSCSSGNNKMLNLSREEYNDFINSFNSYTVEFNSKNETYEIFYNKSLNLNIRKEYLKEHLYDKLNEELIKGMFLEKDNVKYQLRLDYESMISIENQFSLLINKLFTKYTIKVFNLETNEYNFIQFNKKEFKSLYLNMVSFKNEIVDYKISIREKINNANNTNELEKIKWNFNYIYHEFSESLLSDRVDIMDNKNNSLEEVLVEIMEVML